MKRITPFQIITCGFATMMWIGQLTWPVHAHELPAIPTLPKTLSPPITTVASDTQAVKLFFKNFSHTVGVTPRRSTGARLQRQTSHLRKALTQPAITFMAEFAAFRYLTELIDACETQDWETVQLLATQDSKHHTWMRQNLPPSSLAFIPALSDTLSHLMAIHPGPISDSTHYGMLTETVSRTYPTWLGSEDSWIALIQREGYSGVRARVDHIWATLVSSNHTASPMTSGGAQEAKPGDIDHYLKFHFLPIFQAHILTQLVNARDQQRERTFNAHHLLTQLIRENREASGLLRLCGTWQWTVHNHQNHQDHKMTIEFPLPDRLHTMNPPPTTVTVRGDTIYMRWDFPRGFQENSLLFSGHDKRMEGTFYNSMGPNGNITGRRIAPCQNQPRKQ